MVRCRREFTEFSGTYISRLHIPFNDLAYLIHVFVLGVPAYRIAREVGINRVTAERLFRVFREAIYDHGIGELKKLSGKLELDEAMFGGHRKGKGLGCVWKARGIRHLSKKWKCDHISCS